MAKDRYFYLLEEAFSPALITCIELVTPIRLITGWE